LITFANGDLMSCETETGDGGPYKPGDIYSSPRSLEFMATMMNNEISKERDERVAAFKETYKDFFNCYDDWKKEEQDLDAETSYFIAVKMLEKHKIPIVDEDNLNCFLESIYEETSDKGIFLSAMINTLYENERISIYPDGQKISYIGMNNDGKEIFVWGWLHDFAGMNMKAGIMEIMQGISGINIGEGMEGGKISIGDAYGYKVNTDTQLSQDIKGGEIIYNDKCVWPEMTFGESAKKWAGKLLSQ